MSDLREFSFGDWYNICMKLFPAMIIAILFVPFALIWQVANFDRSANSN